MPAAVLPPIDSLWNYKDSAGTEARFREVIPAAESVGDVAYLAELMTQIARCEGRQGKLDAAHATLDRVERMLTPDMKRAGVRCLLERGRAFNSNGRPADALPLFERAWDVAREAGELRLAFDAVHMVAIAQPSPAAQVEWNLKGIDLVRQHPSEQGWLYAFYNNLGEAYAAQSDYENALAAFRDLAALKTAKDQEPEPYTQKDIAKMLRLLGRTTEALAVIEPLHARLTSEGKQDGWIDEELAECLLALGKSADAKPLFQRTYESQKNEPWVVQNEPKKLERLKALAEA